MCLFIYIFWSYLPPNLEAKLVSTKARSQENFSKSVKVSKVLVSSKDKVGEIEDFKNRKRCCVAKLVPS